MAGEFYKHNVPQTMIRKWSDDTKHVAWYDPFTGKEKKSANLTSLYRVPLTGLKTYEMSAIAYLSANSTTAFKDLYEGKFHNLKIRDSVLRNEILFLFLSNPVYQEKVILQSGEHQKEFDLSSYKGAELKAMKTALHSTFVASNLNEILLDELVLYDLEPCLLHAPSSCSFIIGGNPVVISNPFLGKDIASVPFYGCPYLMRGAFLALPLSPDTLFCLYDKNTYTLQSDTLTPSDVDIINMEELYSAGEGDGVVYKGERDYVDKLFKSLSDAKKKRTTTIRSDHYPFDSKLSIMTLKGRRDISMRDFAYDLRKYNGKYIRRLNIRKPQLPLSVRFSYFEKRFKDGVYVSDNS